MSMQQGHMSMQTFACTRTHACLHQQTHMSQGTRNHTPRTWTRHARPTQAHGTHQATGRRRAKAQRHTGSLPRAKGFVVPYKGTKAHRLAPESSPHTHWGRTQTNYELDTKTKMATTKMVTTKMVTSLTQRQRWLRPQDTKIGTTATSLNTFLRSSSLAILAPTCLSLSIASFRRLAAS